jgi:hypothetical protein
MKLTSSYLALVSGTCDIIRDNHRVGYTGSCVSGCIPPFLCCTRRLKILSFRLFTPGLMDLPCYGLSLEMKCALGPTQPPIQWVPGALSLGGKAAGA